MRKIRFGIAVLFIGLCGCICVLAGCGSDGETGPEIACGNILKCDTDLTAQTLEEKYDACLVEGQTKLDAYPLCGDEAIAVWTCYRSLTCGVDGLSEEAVTTCQDSLLAHKECFEANYPDQG